MTPVKKSMPWEPPGRLKANGVAGWRKCARCKAWVIGAMVDGLLTKLDPSGVGDRQDVIRAALAGENLFKIGRWTRGVVWVSPITLARDLSADPNYAPTLYPEHEHVSATVLMPSEDDDAPSRARRASRLPAKAPF